MINNFSVIRIRSTRIYQSISQAAADRAKFNGFFFLFSVLNARHQIISKANTYQMRLILSQIKNKKMYMYKKRVSIFNRVQRVLRKGKNELRSSGHINGVVVE